jgi:hypothetical protein
MQSLFDGKPAYAAQNSDLPGLAPKNVAIGNSRFRCAPVPPAVTLDGNRKPGQLHHRHFELYPHGAPARGDGRIRRIRQARLAGSNGKARENRAAVACGPTPAGCPKPAASASNRAPARLEGKASGTSSGGVSNCLIAGATIAAEIRPGMVRRDASELAKLRNY